MNRTSLVAVTQGMGGISPEDGPDEAGSQEPIPGTKRDALIWMLVAGVGFIVGGILSQVGVVAWGLASGVGSASRLARLESSAMPPEGLVLCNLVGLWVGLIGAALVVSRLRGTRRFAKDMGLAIRLWPDVPLGLVAGAMLQLVVIPVLYVPFIHLIPNLKHQFSRPAERLGGASHGNGVLLLALFVAVIAPIVEEIFFRGVLMRSLEGLSRSAGRFVSWMVPVVGSALLFGLAHFEPLQFMGLVVLGLVLAIIARRTRRLGLGIVAHAAFNGFALFEFFHVHLG